MLNKININSLNEIAIEAGKAILGIYEKDFEVYEKDDLSPLTEADKLSNKIICDFLLETYPDIPILSEEGKSIDFNIRKNWDYYWCIDPLDGTKEFIKKNGEFTVNIALIYNGTPVIGVVYAPVLETLYYAKKGEGAYKVSENLKFKLPLENNSSVYNVVASRSHLSSETEDFIEKLRAKYDKVELISIGSSLKICLVAENKAQCYPRLAPTMEWDTAAAHAVILESGKSISEYQGEKLSYNKENLLNPWFVVE